MKTRARRHPSDPQWSAQLTIDETFDYAVRRQRRKTIALHVLEDATVEVRAPHWVPRAELVAFVESRSAWVVEQRREVLKRLAQRPQFIQGQKHYFLGHSYPLFLQVAARARVSQDEGGFRIHVPDRFDTVAVARALDRWYRQRAQAIYEERLFASFESFPDWFQDHYPMPALKIRKMQRRWGSCSSRGVITLNLALIKMPVACIDYVICHELCHLEVFHHGRSFYDLLEQVVPDWRQLEGLVDQFADV